MVKAQVLHNSLICEENIGIEDGVMVDISISRKGPVRDMFHGCLQIDDIRLVEEIAESDYLSEYS